MADEDKVIEVAVADEGDAGRPQVLAADAVNSGDHNFISLFFVKNIQTCQLDKALRVGAPFFAEFFGTLMLTTVISLTAVGNPLAPLAIGGILMSMVFTYGHLSGGMYNPAVSMAVMIRGKINVQTFLGYVLAQVIGAICGALVGQHTFDHPEFGDFNNLPMPTPAVGPMKGFLLEFLFTYTLCCAVLNTATSDSIGPNSFYGLTIGTVVGSGAIATGGYAGAVFNPAVACGLYTAKAVAATTATQRDAVATAADAHLWLYWVAPMMAGFVAGMMFHILNSDENSNITFEDKKKEDAVGPQFRPSMAHMMSTK